MRRNEIGLISAFILVLSTQSIIIRSLFDSIDKELILSTLYVVRYVLITFLILMERKNLAEFGFDRGSLILFILSTLVRTHLNFSGEIWFLSIIIIAGLVCSIVVVRNWSKLPKINWTWVIVGLVCGFITALIMVIFNVVFYGGAYIEFSTGSSSFSYFLDYFIGTFSTGTMLEEFIFRGFLFGYLIRAGLSESLSLWVQGICFWLIHGAGLIPVIGIFIFVTPLVALVSALLRKYSKQLSASTAWHMAHNGLVMPILAFFAR